MVRLRHLSGDRLPGGLVVEEELGAGTFGTVYRCRAADDTARAVKEMHSFNDPLATPQALAFFQRECEVLSRLDHPAIPHSTALVAEGPWSIDPATGLESAGPDAVAVPARYYLVMDYLPGPTLETLVREAVAGGELPPFDEVIGWARQIGDALGAVHAAGLVHRDVKPANLLIREPDRAAFLIDFGLCKPACEPGGYETVPLSTSGRFGTRGYAPPDPVEQENPTPASDQHALGMALRRALTGLDPTDLADLATLREHRLTDLCPTLPPHQAAACDRAISEAPADRYPSVADFLEALESAPVGLPLPATFIELTPAELLVGPIPRGQLRDLALRVADRRPGMRVVGHAATTSEELRLLPAHEQGNDIVLHLMLRIRRTATLGPATARLIVHANDEEHVITVQYEVVEATPTGCAFPFG